MFFPAGGARWFYCGERRHICARFSRPSVGGRWERSIRLRSVGFLRAESKLRDRSLDSRSSPKLRGIICTNASGPPFRGAGAPFDAGVSTPADFALVTSKADTGMLQQRLPHL